MPAAEAGPVYRLLPADAGVVGDPGLMRRIDELHLQYPFAEPGCCAMSSGARAMEGTAPCGTLNEDKQKNSNILIEAEWGTSGESVAAVTARHRASHQDLPYLLRHVDQSRAVEPRMGSRYMPHDEPRTHSHL